MERYQLRRLQTTNGTTRFLSRDAYLASETDQRTVVEGDYLLGDGPTFLMVSGLYVGNTDRTVSAQRVPSPDAVNATDATRTATGGTNETTADGVTTDGVMTDGVTTNGITTDRVTTDGVTTVGVGVTDDVVSPARTGNRDELTRPVAVEQGGGVA